uniref:Multidrug and toxin extrusion protein n=1 Tax=Sus scrofa TaxID=9823 RepID=A0A8D1N7E8_PIG
MLSRPLSGPLRSTFLTGLPQARGPRWAGPSLPSPAHRPGRALRLPRFSGAAAPVGVTRCPSLPRQFLAQLMTFLISIVSSIFCGHLGRAELDAVMLAVSVVNVSGISIGTGLASACDTLMSQSFGGRNLKRVGVILQRGVLILLLCCLPCWAIFINTESLLRLLKQDPEVSRSAASPAGICFLFYLQATFLFQLQAKYLQNQGIILPQVITGIVANILNVGMNALLLSALDLGMQGSAWANTTSQFFLCALLFLYLRWKKIHVDTWGGWTMDCFQEWGSFIQLAIPSMFMVCIEWWTFEVGTFLAGLISVTELGAQAVVYELVTAAYTVPLGFGVAASVRVGNALGAGNPEQARHSGVTVLLCAGVCALVISTVLAALKDVVAYGTSGGVLRGTGKQKMGAFSNAIGYYVFGFPLGVSLMFAAHHGIIGLWSGLTVCVSLQTLFYLVHIWRTDWTSAAQQAQVRAGLRRVRAAEPTGTELPILEKDGPRGVILPDVVRPERQATQLMGTESSDQDAVPTVGAVLTGGQLLLYRGLACALAVATLAAGVAVRLLHGRG